MKVIRGLHGQFSNKGKTYAPSILIDDTLQVQGDKGCEHSEKCTNCPFPFEKLNFTPTGCRIRE